MRHRQLCRYPSEQGLGRAARTAKNNNARQKRIGEDQFETNSSRLRSLVACRV